MGPEVDQLARADDADLDLRTGFAEAGQTWKQPLGGKGGRAPMVSEPVTTLRRSCEVALRVRTNASRISGSRIAPAGGEGERAARPTKQDGVQMFLKSTDPMADRRGGDAKLVRSLGEAEMPRHGLEGAQKIERRQKIRHGVSNAS
jgi:hypothetical protein